MKRIILTTFAALLCVASYGFTVKQNLLSGGEKLTSQWMVEAQDDATTVKMIGDNSMDVVATRGLTMWYDKKLSGEYQISYSVKFIMEGGAHDRLSDLNCFWGAVDPQSPKDIYKRSAWRDGMFGNYRTMDLFYVGYGGNKNRTTRFRRYHAEHYESGDNEKIRPVIAEYLKPEDLLKPNQWLNVVITVKDGRTTYSMDGKELFNHPLLEGQDEGYFGLRLLKNHTVIKNFKIKEYTKADTYKYDEVIAEEEALETIKSKWGEDFKYVEYPTQYLKNVVEVAPGESIQAAIDAVSVKGGVVKLLAGTHVVKQSITLKSNITLIGEGVNKTIVEEGKGLTKECFTASPAPQIVDVVMKDFSLVGKDIGSVQGIWISGKNGSRHDRIMLQNVEIKGWGSHGAHIKRADNVIMDKCTFVENGSRNGLYHNCYFLYNKNILQSDCDFSYPVKGKGCKYTSCEFVLAQRCTIDKCIGNGIQADNEETGYLMLHKYKISNCGQVALWFPCEYYYGKFDYTEDAKYAPQNVILSRCEIVDNKWGAMWRVVGGKSYVMNKCHFSNQKIDMGLLLCGVEISEDSKFEKGNRLMDDLKKWPMDVHLLW
ncbi:MAG: DUF6250 domain-containing protein [Rikenellaceae bacterium]